MTKRLYFIVFSAVALLGCGGDDVGPMGGDRGQGSRRNPGQFSSSPEFQQVSVKAYRVERAPISTYILSNTSLEPIRQVTITARLNALVERILVEEGDRVSQNQVLARLDDREIRNEHRQATIAVDQSKIQVQQAEVRSKQSKANYERSVTLRDQKLISQQEFDTAALANETDALAFDVSKQQLEGAEARLAAVELQLEYTEIRSSISGVVTERLIEVGDRVNANQEVFAVEDFTPLWARIFVPEKELSLIRVGQVARIRIEAFPDRDFHAVVKMINPRVDAVSATVKVTLEVSEHAGLLRPGMFGVVYIATETHDNAVVVPKKALLRERDENRVFVIKDDFTVEKRSVQLGIAEENRVEVLSGVSQGESIVTVGQESLNDGYPVKILAWEGDAAPNLAEQPAPASTAIPAPNESGRGGDPAQDRGVRNGGQGAPGGRQGGPGRGGQGGRFGGGDPNEMFQRFIDSNPELKKEYEKRLKDDPSLATDAEKRRAFIMEMRTKLGLGRGRGRQ